MLQLELELPSVAYPDAKPSIEFEARGIIGGAYDEVDYVVFFFAQSRTWTCYTRDSVVGPCGNIIGDTGGVAAVTPRTIGAGSIYVAAHLVGT